MTVPLDDICLHLECLTAKRRGVASCRMGSPDVSAVIWPADLPLVTERVYDPSHGPPVLRVNV
jgi:hypothetical protein